MGIGIYLPMSATFAVVVGAILVGVVQPTRCQDPNPDRAERLGTLVASGLIVGESLWGVLNAGLIVGLSNDAPIALVAEDFGRESARLRDWSMARRARIRRHPHLALLVDAASIENGAGSIKEQIVPIEGLKIRRAEANDDVQVSEMFVSAKVYEGTLQVPYPSREYWRRTAD